MRLDADTGLSGEPGAVQSDFILWHQFKICRSQSDPASWLPGFRSVSVDGWWVHAHDVLPVLPLRAPSGRYVGCVLGWPIDGEVVRCADMVIPDSGGECESERKVPGWGGRWLCFRSDTQTVFLDSLGTLPAVYDEETGYVGSSAGVLRTELLNGGSYSGVFPDNAPNQYFPCGLTRFPRISRLLPNHALDMKRGKALRVWSGHGLEAGKAGEETQVCADAIESVHRNIAAAARCSEQLVCGLTAGRDSRVILAAMGDDEINQTHFITFNEPRSSQLKMDVHIAKRLAKKFRLRHSILDIEPPTPSERTRYLQKIGVCGGSGKVRDFYNGLLPYSGRKRCLITGFGGEVAVAYYCRDGDDSKIGICPKDLLNRFGLPEKALFIDAIENWVHEIGGQVSRSTIIELFYIENRIGSWASVHSYGIAPFGLYLIPFSDPVYRDCCWSLPLDFRRNRASQLAMIKARKPELLDVPFEEYVGLAWIREKLVRNRFWRVS